METRTQSPVTQSDIDAVTAAWQRAIGDPGAQPNPRALRRALGDWPADRLIRAVHLAAPLHKQAVRRWKDNGRGALPRFTMRLITELCQGNLDDLEERTHEPAVRGPRGKPARRWADPTQNAEYLQQCHEAYEAALKEPEAVWEIPWMIRTAIGAFMAEAPERMPPTLFQTVEYQINMGMQRVRNPLTAAGAVEIGRKLGIEHAERLKRVGEQGGRRPRKGGA